MIHEFDLEVAKANLSVSICMDLIANAMIALHRREASAPARSKLPLSHHGDMLMTMPGVLSNDGVAGVKTLMIRPRGAGPSVQGLVTLYELESGTPVATLDAAPITELRTAAASALATTHLAREDARALAILGTGVQARSHIEAMLVVRPVERVLIWGRSTEKAQLVAHWAEAHLNVEVSVGPSAESIVSQADIICTVTSGPTPIMKGEWVRPGAHINIVGAHTPSTREVDTDAVKRSRLFVETRAAALEEAGDILMPLNAGEINEDHVLGELADVLLGKVKGRVGDADITAYKSLGNIVQDLAIAHHIVQRMRGNTCR